MGRIEHVDAETFDRLARDAIAELEPGSDVDAMLVSFSLIRAANRIQQDLETTVHRPAGVTWAAFRVLWCMSVVGPTAPSQLAHLSSVSAASISGVLRTLERGELITRQPSADDARSVLVDLTPLGRRTVHKLLMENNTREIAWVQALTPRERHTLARLLHKLLMHHPAPPEAPDPERAALASARRSNNGRRRDG